MEKESEETHSFLPSSNGKKLFISINNQNIVIEGKTRKFYTLPSGEIVYKRMRLKTICGTYENFSWDPTGEKLIFVKTKEDGHTTISSELFLCNWDGTNIRHIKFEKKRIRYNPSFGPSDMITYIFDDENHKPCIGVAKLLLQMKHK